MIVMSLLFSNEQDLNAFKTTHLSAVKEDSVIVALNPTLEELGYVKNVSKETAVTVLTISSDRPVIDFLCGNSKAVSKQWLNDRGNWQSEVIKPYIY